MIIIKNLEKKFGKIYALKDINMEIEKGKITSLIGPNASGKTTLIKSILGLVIPTNGKILVNDIDIFKDYRYRKNIGYTSQLANFPDNLTVNEFFNMMQDIRGKNAEKKLKDLIEIFELESQLNKKIKSLSGGTKQKVNIILALMFDPEILIFDEPTVGLDPITSIKFKKLILEEKNKGKTIIYVSHIINEIEDLADNLGFMIEGKITFFGSIQELKERTNTQNLEDAIVCSLNS
jgi:Cu-processing system ATP-binding protein